MNDIRKSIAETREIFKELVWPIWAGSFDAATLVSTEGSEKPFELFADYAGVDAFFARRLSGTIIPLASRIEFAWSDDEDVSRRLNRTFTVRSAILNQEGWSDRTELRRLVDAATDPVSRRYLPFRTIQSLVSRCRTKILFSSSICTQGLADYVALPSNNSRLNIKINKAQDRRFARINVSDLIHAGVLVETRP